MSVQENVTFHEALDIIESLPEEQQENLVKIVQQRLIERRRGILAKNIKKAQKEYMRGEVKRGTVDDLIQELS